MEGYGHRANYQITPADGTSGAVFGPLAISMTVRVLWIVGVVIVILMIIPLIFRARRYARAPTHFATLYAGGKSLTPWLFWQAVCCIPKRGMRIRFGKRLAPFTILRPNEAYNIYYLKEAKVNVLLSLAPATIRTLTCGSPANRSMRGRHDEAKSNILYTLL